MKNPIGNRTFLYGRTNFNNLVFEGEHVEDCIVVGSNSDYRNAYYFDYYTLHNKGSYAEGIVIYDHEIDKWSIDNTEE